MIIVAFCSVRNSTGKFLLRQQASKSLDSSCHALKTILQREHKMLIGGKCCWTFFQLSLVHRKSLPLSCLAQKSLMQF